MIATKKVLLLNGPNLNLLGMRNTDVYGVQTLAQIEGAFRAHVKQAGYECDCLQSNHEGALIDAIHAALGEYVGIVYNPGAHAHYSYALRDAIEAIPVPVAEVHISDIHAREAFRDISVIEPVCVASICGHGAQGYLEAFDALLQYV